MKSIRIERPVGSWTQPHIIINPRRNFSIWTYRDALEPIHISPSFYSPDLSQGSRMNIVDRIRPMLSTSLPLTHLNDSFVIIRRIHHPFCFTDGIGYRLFDINVLSCRDSINHLQAMPVIRGGNDNGVNVSVAQQTPVIFIQQRLTSEISRYFSLAFRQDSIVDITQGGTAHIGI